MHESGVCARESWRMDEAWRAHLVTPSPSRFVLANAGPIDQRNNAHLSLFKGCGGSFTLSVAGIAIVWSDTKVCHVRKAMFCTEIHHLNAAASDARRIICIMILLLTSISRVSWLRIHLVCNQAIATRAQASIASM